MANHGATGPSYLLCPCSRRIGPTESAQPGVTRQRAGPDVEYLIHYGMSTDTPQSVSAAGSDIDSHDVAAIDTNRQFRELDPRDSVDRSGSQRFSLSSQGFLCFSN